MRKMFWMVLMLTVLASGVQGQQQPDPALPCQDCCPDPPCYPEPPDYPQRVVMYYPWWSGVGPQGQRCGPGPSDPLPSPDGRCPKWSDIIHFWFHPDFDANGVFDWVPGRSTSVDLYDDQNIEVVKTQIDRMGRAWVSGLVASWWGKTSWEHDKIIGAVFPALDQQRNGLVDGTFYYESKGGRLERQKIKEALVLLSFLWQNYPTRVLRTGDGRPVVFIYAPWYDGISDHCDAFRAWKEEVLDKFQSDFGVRPFLVADFHDNALSNCAAYHHRGDWGWHYYGTQGGYYNERWAYGFRNTQTLSPGFARHCWGSPEQGNRECKDPDQEYGIPRDPQAFEAAATMAQRYWKRARYFQIITSWNEWLEFTAVEPAVEWWSSSGLGTYLDILAAHPVP